MIWAPYEMWTTPMLWARVGQSGVVLYRHDRVDGSKRPTTGDCEAMLRDGEA